MSFWFTFWELRRTGDWPGICTSDNVIIRLFNKMDTKDFIALMDLMVTSEMEIMDNVKYVYIYKIKLKNI